MILFILSALLLLTIIYVGLNIFIFGLEVGCVILILAVIAFIYMLVTLIQDKVVLYSSIGLLIAYLIFVFYKNYYSKKNN